MSDVRRKAVGEENIKVPRHVAVIMDGNGRWAAKRKQPRLAGHREGAKSVEATIRAAADLGIEFLTLYAFSVENWSRPRSEIKGLMGLLLKVLRDYEKTMEKESIRVVPIGRLADLPPEVASQLERTARATVHNKRLTVLLALSYGGRVEITEACRELARKAVAGSIRPEDIDEGMISSHLYTAGFPDPDLLIRTSGEMRLSNFLLWQASYTELFITPVLWPDFRKKHLQEAVAEYNKRQRRFGGV
ncbi:MAG: isoprenyl transferase [Candidatus Methylacidiphilales bacterium]|nr:isoprenyl transferase [Candidatus Methylacidiphilales bacterium]